MKKQNVPLDAIGNPARQQYIRENFDDSNNNNNNNNKDDVVDDDDDDLYVDALYTPRQTRSGNRFQILKEIQKTPRNSNKKKKRTEQVGKGLNLKEKKIMWQICCK